MACGLPTASLSLLAKAGTLISGKWKSPRVSSFFSMGDKSNGKLLSGRGMVQCGSGQVISPLWTSAVHLSREAVELESGPW